MRIIIESNDSTSAATASLVSPSTAAPEAADAGAPSGQLADTSTDFTYTSATPGGNGLDGGTPPQWLLDAIEEATLASPADEAGSATDAGGAPTGE